MIISVEGKKTESVDDLHRILSDHAVGNSIDLVILRRQERMVLTVTPVEAIQ
jgi:S1-C subfamily serine protease